MNKGNKYGYMIMAACLLLSSCSVFNREAPLRQCYTRGDLKIVLRGETAEQSGICIYEKGREVYAQELLPHLAVVTNLVKDTIYLAYFSEQPVDRKSGRTNAGSRWLIWEVYPRSSLTEANGIAAAKAVFNGNRVEVQAAGADVKLSFPLNALIYDKERLMIFTFKGQKGAWRQLQLDEEGSRAFKKQFGRYGEDGILKE